jgi:membrane protease YdiL (CAAX protease family)
MNNLFIYVSYANWWSIHEQKASNNPSIIVFYTDLPPVMGDLDPSRSSSFWDWFHLYPSALILTAIIGGQTAVRTLLGRLAIWRVGWSWWAVAVLVQPILLILAGLIYNVMWGNPLVTMLPVGVTSAFVINIIFLAIATLGEEIGWRGVALPSLQSLRTALNASLILGFLWAAWHIPFWLLMDTFNQYGWTYMLLNFLFVLPGTFYITWFFNHSRSSLLLPVVFHLSFNILNTGLFPVTATSGAFALFIAIEWLVTILIIRRLEPPLDKGIS